MKQLLGIVWWIVKVPIILAQGVIEFILRVVIGFALYILFYVVLIVGLVWFLTM